MSIITDLNRLGRVRAPAGFVRSVMAAVGAGDDYAEVDSDLGRLYVAFNREGLSAVMRAGDEERFTTWFSTEFRRPLRRVAELPPRLRRRLTFDLGGLTEFEQAVLRKTLEIPRGQVRTYGWVAREIGRPGAVRAVGTALAHNPIPYFIPCHRVVRSDGSIGDYSAGGPAAKRQVLRAEGVDPDALESMARAHIRFLGSDTTHIFCLPTCRYARRVKDVHEVRFRSEKEARARGYRPCKVCRPAAAA